MTTFQPPRPGDAMIDVEEAQRRVLAEVTPLASEEVALADALGRVLREDVRASHDIPSGDNSAMDGYAVRAEDTTPVPVALRVIDDLPAGRITTRAVERGTAIRIMTGALLPAGADSVVQVEHTDAGRDVVEIRERVKPGTNVRRRGEDMNAGDVVLRAGTRIRAAELGVLAAARKSRVVVSRIPTVAILSTGDELVEIDEPFTTGKVVNSNAWSLAALVRERGAHAEPRGTVRDDLPATIAAIEAALACDFVLSSGGVSAGAYDFVKDALDHHGGDTKFWRIAMKPGKPVVLSRVRDRLFFGLPGNPVSCMVAFHLFVAPALRKAAGEEGVLTPPVVRLRTRGALRAKGDRRTYLRVRVVAEGGELVAYPMRAQGSGVSTSMLGANGLARLEAGVVSVNADELVDIVLLDSTAAPGSQ